MRSLRISHTIYLLLGLALLAGGVASTYLMMRSAGISDRYKAIAKPSLNVLGCELAEITVERLAATRKAPTVVLTT